MKIKHVCFVLFAGVVLSADPIYAANETLPVTDERVMGSDTGQEMRTENMAESDKMIQDTFSEKNLEEQFDMETTEDRIRFAETEPVIDEDGNVTITVNTAEDILLPLSLIMKGSDGSVTFTVSRSGQKIKIKPGEYQLTKAMDGNEQKLPIGAYLQIPQSGGLVYLDFHKPANEPNTFLDFIISNIVFIPLGLLLWGFYKWYIIYSVS